MAQKVVQVLYSGLGGHGSVAFSLARAAQGAWENQFIFFGIEPTLDEYRERCEGNRYGFRRIKVAKGKTWLYWRQLHQMLCDLRPDAIILHSVKTIIPCALYAKREGIPLIAVEHQPNALKSRSEWLISHLAMRLAKSVVVLTNVYKDELRRVLGRNWRGNKVYLIPNGIDTDQFHPSERSPGNSTIRVGMAARFSKLKKQQLLVRAISILSKQEPGRWQLSMPGDGSELREVQNLIVDNELENQVFLPGYLGERDLVNWFHGLDIYAHASDGETLSTSLLQAISSGLPVVGSNVPGITNLLSQNGGVGIHPDSETAVGFAEALHRIARNRDEANRLSRNARDLALKGYSQREMFKRYQDLIGDA